MINLKFERLVEMVTFQLLISYRSKQSVSWFLQL